MVGGRSAHPQSGQRAVQRPQRRPRRHLPIRRRARRRRLFPHLGRNEGRPRDGVRRRRRPRRGQEPENRRAKDRRAKDGRDRKESLAVGGRKGFADPRKSSLLRCRQAAEDAAGFEPLAFARQLAFALGFDVRLSRRRRFAFKRPVVERRSLRRVAAKEIRAQADKAPGLPSDRNSRADDWVLPRRADGIYVGRLLHPRKSLRQERFRRRLRGA